MGFRILMSWAFPNLHMQQLHYDGNYNVVKCVIVQSRLILGGLFGPDTYIISIFWTNVEIWVPHLHKNLNISKTTC